jgi:hypothetical protein
MADQLHPDDIEERKEAFQRVWRRRFLDEVALLPPTHQGRVHELLKRSFYAGSNFERRRQEPTRLGGDN